MLYEYYKVTYFHTRHIAQYMPICPGVNPAQQIPVSWEMSQKLSYFKNWFHWHARIQDKNSQIKILL